MSDGSAMPHFPTMGVRLCVFLEFVESMGGKEAFYTKSIVKEPLTTTEVCNMFLKPATSGKGQSYCELLADINSPDIGEASVFISHAWKYKFLDVVDALQHYFSNEPDIFIWFDLFSNNQHRAPNLPFEWWRDTFSNAIGKMGRVVMVLSPWNNPDPFTRAWCLWEIYCTVKTGSKFEVAFSPEEQEAFVSEITHDSAEFFQMLANINVEKSESFNPADKNRIFDAVESSVGFTEVNKMVIGTMRDWVIFAIDESIQRSQEEILKSKGSVDVEKDARLAMWGKLLAKMRMLEQMGKHEEALEIGKKCLADFADMDEGEKYWGVTHSHLGSVYTMQGSYPNAIEYFGKSLEVRLKILGDEHIDVAMSNNDLGRVYHKQGNNIKALEYYEKSLKIRLKTLSEEHPHVADSYSHLGTVYTEGGNYLKALEYYEKSLKIRLKTLGEEHPHVADSYSHLGTVYYFQHMYPKAIEYYEKAIEIRSKTLGEEHPTLGFLYNNLGSVYERQGAYPEAIKGYEKCLKIYLKSFGGEHPDVGGSYNNLGSVHDRQGNHIKAIEYYEKSIEIKSKTLGEEHPSLAFPYNNLGAVYEKQGIYLKALKCYEKILDIYLKSFGDEHSHVAVPYTLMAGVYTAQGSYPKAIEYYEKSLAIYSKTSDCNDPNIGIVRHNLKICRNKMSLSS